MTKSLLIIPLLVTILWANGAEARDIYLEIGDSYSSGDLNVMCVEQKSVTPLVLKECQYWDDFNQKCLFEKKVFSFGDLLCAEECQHWDDFNKVCKYVTTCRFFPDHKTFIKTTCRDFDTFNNICRDQQETKIDGK